jgi:ATPase subunit of ABC transporter with duplicated ATPase domains
VGRNGSGKTTLLRAISERSAPPFDHIPAGVRILHVQQEAAADNRTPLEAVLSADVERAWLLAEARRLEGGSSTADEETNDTSDDEASYTLRDVQERLREIDAQRAEPRAAQILAGLGFAPGEMDTKPAKAYSGGWRTRPGVRAR